MSLKFTIVTPSLNQGSFIERTILSVLKQNYPEVEHIIIDGGSQDNTLNVLKKYSHLRWVSEPDSGQSNAINKGFKMASGDILAWINADDYYEENIFPNVAEYFEKYSNIKVVYGDMTFVDRDGNKLFTITGDTINHENLKNNPDIVRQSSFFWRKEVIDECGMLDESLHLVMDYEFFLRVSKKYDFGYIPKNISYYSYYVGTKTYSLQKKQIYEIYSVYRKNHIPLNLPRILFLMKKYVKSFRLVFRILRKLRGEGRV